MATVAEDRLLHLLKSALRNSSVDTFHAKVCRKNKDLSHGDFVVPRGVLNIDLESDSETTQLETVIQQSTTKDILPISSVTQDTYNSLIFRVHRPAAYANIIQGALSAGENYGRQPSSDKGPVVVNPVDLHGNASVDQSSTTLTQLRAVVLLKHVLHLLLANGYQAEVASFPTMDDTRDLLSVLGVTNTTTCVQTDVDAACQQLSQQAGTSPWHETVQGGGGKGGGGEDEEGGEGRDGLVLNVRRFVEDAGLLVGKNGYDRNLRLVNVRLTDGTVSEAVKMAAVTELMTTGMEATAEASDSAGESERTPAWCVHIVSQSLAYTQQQADLVWRICNPHQHPHHTPHHNPQQCWSQHHFVFGTVGQRKSFTAVMMGAREFYNVRHRQMTQAAMMKYGDHDQGAGWDDMISGLTAASVTFDLLTTASSSQAQLDLSEDDGEGGVDNRSGPFVLYNCARLASLLHSFEQQVQQGVYPALPDPAQVDFHLLREEEEWTLAFLYIHGFPRLVAETLHTWPPTQGITASIHTHKVAHFLINFSKALSSYYSRYHILGGAESHLLPLMFARLSLMKAAHRVLCNGLTLLGLQPFSQL